MRSDERCCGGTLQQHGQALMRHFCLRVLSKQRAEGLHKVCDGGQVIDKKSEVADADMGGMGGEGHNDENEACADADGVAENGVEQAGEDAVAQHHGTTTGIQSIEVRDDIWFGTRNLNRLYRAKDFTNGAG